MLKAYRLRRITPGLLLCSLLLAGVAHAQTLATQTIQFLPISDRPVTSAPFQVVALSSAELPVTLSVEGPATLDTRRLLTLTAPGLVTVTATQPGNTEYSATTAKLSFHVTPAPTTLTWQPQTLVYGLPLSAAGLASAAAIPMFSPAADVPVVTTQLNSSQLAPGGPISYPYSSPLFRYEGSTMASATDPYGHTGYIPNGSLPPFGLTYRVAFSCDCQQFEFVMRSQQSSYRLWVDGSYSTIDDTYPADYFPKVSYNLVQFPDKRLRQIKISIGGAPPFYGIVTTGSDTISAPQVPVGPRVIIFGDSWTGPKIGAPYLPPAQDGLYGSGYPQFLGEFFNWDYWDSGVGGEGFINPGTDGNQHDFPQRVLTDVCPFSPAALVLMGGVNDGGATEQNEQEHVAQTLSNLATCLPGMPVALYGPQFTDPNIDAAFAAAVVGYNNVHWVDMGEQNWLYGSYTSAATGNEYLYFSGHPTPLGHDYLAEKIAMDLITTYPALLPAPYPLMAPAPAAGEIGYSLAGASWPSTALMPAGANTVTASFTPSDSVDYAPSELTATVLVNKANTVTQLQQSQPGSSEILVTIQPQIGGVPTGAISVQDLNTGATLPPVTLHNGGATYSTSALGGGEHLLSFAYSGDANFNPSAASIQITPGSPLAR